jgi:hypothetical protein
MLLSSCQGWSSQVSGHPPGAPGRYLVREAGVRQFLDIGAGLPAANSTHEVAQRVAPDCRVVYVDNGPVVLAHARVLSRDGWSAFQQAGP